MELKEEGAPAALDADMARELAALQGEAAAVEGHAPAAPGAAPQATDADTAAELLGALEMARMMVAPMFAWWPEFAATWSDAQLEKIAEGGAAVMQRHGWTLGGLFSEFGPYIALAGATLPPAFVTYQAMQARRENEARAPQRPAAAPAP